MRPGRLYPWVLLALLVGELAGAGPDQVQIAMLGRYPLPLRWDNVAGTPLWVAGAKPFSMPGGHVQDPDRHETRMHRVRLSPGESVTVWVPASEGLRIYRPEARLAPGDLEIAVSNGSGLYVTAPVQPAAAGDSLLLPPDWLEERLARVARPAQAREALEVALFVSRREALGELAPYRKRVQPESESKPAPESESGPATNPATVESPPMASREILPVTGDRVWLRPTDQATAQPFWPLQAQPSLRVHLQGPLRLALEHRLRYPPPETQVRQAYRVYAWLDGRPWRALDFVAGQETRRAIGVDDCAETLGRLEIGYLELPEGDHELTLAATQPLYARLLIQEEPDYLFPGLNAPRLTAAQARAMQPTTPHGSIWDLTPTELSQPLNRLTLADQERVALRLGRDNRYRDGGLTAALAMRQAALAHREAPRLAPQAQDLLGLFTFYRSLLPTAKPTAAPPRLAWLRNRRLTGVGERSRELLIAERFGDDLLNTLAAASFLELTPDAELEYRLPERRAPSILRVAVDPSTAATVEFLLRYDDQPPLRLRAQPPELAPHLFLPGTGEAAVLLLSERHGAPTASPLTAPFAAQRPPGPLVSAALVEIPLPANVRRIRLGNASQPLWVALQYRASRPYQLSESEYLEMVRQLGAEGVYQQFQTQARTVETTTEPLAELTSPIQSFATTRDAQHELANHWLPLTRLLRQQTRHLTMTLGPPPTFESARLDTGGRLDEARRLQQTGQWLPALEHWSPLTRSPTASIRAESVLGEARALRQLDEKFLAELMLRGAFVHDPDPTVRAQAFAQLVQDYTTAGDEAGLLMVVSAAATRQPEPDRLRQLAGVLLDQGNVSEALAVGLALPPAERPRPVVARAAYQLGWWRVFEQTLTQWPDPVQRRLWQGYRAQQRGDYQEALTRWRDAGAAGQALAEALETGLTIRDRLRNSDPAIREGAIAEWTHWQTRQPGHYTWWDASHLLSDYAGARALYAPERDLFSQTFRALPNRPVKLTVYGPAKLRIEGRLTHPASAADLPPVDDWLLLRDGDRVERLPISGDRPGQGLIIAGDATELPGRKATLEYVVGPGLHDIEIAARQRPLLVQAAVWRPEAPLLVLPELTPASATAAALGLAYGEPPQRQSDRWRWLPFGGYDIRPDESPPDTTAANPGLPIQVIAGCTLEPKSLHTTPAVLPEPAAQAKLLTRLAAHNPPDLVWPTPPPTAEETLRQRLTALLWEVEQAPDTLAQRLPEAEQWVAAQPGTPGVEPLLRRLRQRVEWEPVTTVARSAGIRAVASPGWQPETPFLRVRKALSLPVASDEQVLTGAEQLGLLTTNPTPTRLKVELRVTDVRYLPPQPLTAWHRLDERPEQSVTLTPAAPARSLLLDVPPGQHVLRIGIAAPVANQSLRVRVSELRGRTARPVTDDLRRLYQVATVSEPIQVPLLGPAWLRIDELHPGALDSRYQYLGPGLQTVELRPAQGQAEALYRLHSQRILDTPRETAPPRVTRWTLERAPDAPTPVPAAPPPTKWVMQDRYALGEQQAGTWSLGATLARALPSADETSSSEPPDTYLETLASYRYYDEWRRDYYQADALFRLHRRGNPTFGLLGAWQHQTEWPGVGFRLSWEGYAQQSEAWAWNSTVRGQIWQVRDLDPKTWHSPSLGFFYRDLHQQPGYDYQVGYVDQDVLSQYKYFHRRGLVLANTLSHRPWLDTLWRVGAALTSDEDWNLFDPEHASATVGWKQLLGDWEAHAAYQWTYYFAQGDHDWNRPKALRNNTLRGAVLWDGAWGGQGRLRAGLELQYDIDSREVGSWLSLEWFPDRGRGYRDFRPGQIDFRDLRERMLPLEFNNRMDEPPGEETAQ
mgnify:FL=1